MDKCEIYFRGRIDRILIGCGSERMEASRITFTSLVLETGRLMEP